MRTKTDNAAHVGVHAFEIAGLGKAPFRFTGMLENCITYPDGSTQAGGTCDYCGTGIRYEFHLLSADGQKSKVGCDCIARSGDEGIKKAYLSSPEFRKNQAAKRQAKAESVRFELDTLLAAHGEDLKALPHPRGFIDRQTHQALTLLDYFTWYRENAGASGREGTLKELKRHLAK